ncbi:MAG: GNAT family N-acetyltransferase [Rhodobacterales bacterium CG2_30_65_12]|nr:MAG: GNAT family N-acetyltransferase [Rhodobacterales bacterium CG2_30_65_12]
MTATPAYPHEAPPSGPAAAFAARLQALLPQLETPRLVLRAITIADFPGFFEIFAHPTRSRALGGPFNRSGAWDEFTECVSGWLLRGHGGWAIEEKRGGALLGFTLVHMEYGDREPELGWFLTEAAEGNGFGFEAAEAARAHALDRLHLPALVSYMDPDNTRSARLAERLGAVRDPAAEAEVSALAGEPVMVYRHWPPADEDGGMEAYA